MDLQKRLKYGVLNKIGGSMEFTDICIITSDVIRVSKFYEMIFDTQAEGDAVHASINAAGMRLSFYDKHNAETDMGFDLEGAGTGLITIGFNLEAVDETYQRIKDLGIDSVSEPVVWPWGAKSFNFRDTEGNIVVMRSQP